MANIFTEFTQTSKIQKPLKRLRKLHMNVGSCYSFEVQLKVYSASPPGTPEEICFCFGTTKAGGRKSAGDLVVAGCSTVMASGQCISF